MTTGPKEVTRLGHERDLAEGIGADFACSVSTLAVLRGACCLSFPTAGAWVWGRNFSYPNILTDLSVTRQRGFPKASVAQCCGGEDPGALLTPDILRACQSTQSAVGWGALRTQRGTG